MSIENDDFVNSLKDKIFKLIMLYEKEKEKNNVLLKDKEYLDSQVKEKMAQIEDLKTKYDNLKLGKMIELSGTDVYDARIKINRIVREVDQCIALLNK